MCMARMNGAAVSSIPEAPEDTSSWHRRVYVASRVVLAASGEEEDVPFSRFAPPESFIAYDNTSNQCGRWLESDASCSTPSLPRLALLWTRTLFYKVVRGYGAAPVFLMLAPLLVGLVVGLLVGCRWERSRSRTLARKESVAGGFTSYLSTLFGSLYSRVAFARSMKEADLTRKEDRVRRQLQSDADTQRESGVEIADLPRHIAVIMDGNRRYGAATYGDSVRGHWDGSRTLVDFAKWSIAEEIQVLTMYAFSTENWNRDPAEVASLMALFCKYCDELRAEAVPRNIRVRVLSSDTDKIPAHVRVALQRMVDDTKHCEGGLCMNICLSYGSRGEIVNACRNLANLATTGTIRPDDISERDISDRLLTCHCPDPDLVIRTSGEHRLSNFLLWQLAYSEMIFLAKPWPEVEKEDLLNIIRSYATRQRRFGK